MANLKHYQNLAKQMIEDDYHRDRMFQEMDNMWASKWELPEELEAIEWIHRVTSTDPHDAIRAGTRVLSSVEPRPKLTPLGPLPEDKEKANQIERALLWHFRNASKRRRASVLRDVVMSALLYDEVVAQVIYLPHQIEQIKAFEGDPARLEAAKRFGPFAIVVRNPKDVHVRYSEYMPEAVLLKRLVPLSQVTDFWGKRANKLVKTNEHDDEDPLVSIFDYTDLKRRVVWATISPTGMIEADGDGTLLLDEENKLGFLPWVARVGGTNLYNEGSLQRIPLLWSLYNAGQWETQNIAETLMISEVIAYSGAPRGVSITIDGETPDLDYAELGRTIGLQLGEQYTQIRPPELDANLMAVSDRIQGRVAKSTVPNVLQTGDFPSGTAFATLNLATQSGIKALNPYKELSELAVTDILTQMLYWVDHTEDDVTSYFEDDDGARQITIRKEDFDVNNIYLEVELTADVATDRMARINAALTANQGRLISKERGAEEVGVTDPGMEQRQIRREDETELEHQLRLIQRRAEVEREEQLKTQQAMFELQMQQQQQVQGGGGQAQQAGSLDRLLANRNQPRSRGQGFEATRGGRNFDPSQGGTPPATANPEGTRERQRGSDFQGNEVS